MGTISANDTTAGNYRIVFPFLYSHSENSTFVNINCLLPHASSNPVISLYDNEPRKFQMYFTLARNKLLGEPSNCFKVLFLNLNRCIFCFSALY